MANTAGVSNAAKLAALAVVVNTATVKCALYYATASIDNTVGAYTATGEVNEAGYTAGGASVTNGVSAALDGNTAHWTPGADIGWNPLTATAFNCALIYDTSQTNRSMGVYTFGSQTIVAGQFTLKIPTNNGSTGLLRIG